jgi:hypothetical protein
MMGFEPTVALAASKINMLENNTSIPFRALPKIT